MKTNPGTPKQESRSSEDVYEENEGKEAMKGMGWKSLFYMPIKSKTEDGEKERTDMTEKKKNDTKEKEVM